MRLIKYTIALVLGFSLVAVGDLSAKNKLKKVYMFGFAASFNDSTVYFTNVQEMDSAYIQEKTEFLLDRNNYSYQLRDYLAEKGEEHRTCVTTFSTNRKTIEKKYAKMKKRYTGKGSFMVQYLTPEEFSFQPIQPDENEGTATKSKNKKKDKKGPKPPKGERKGKPMNRPEGMPNGGAQHGARP